MKTAACSEFLQGRKAFKQVCKAFNLRPREVGILLSMAAIEESTGSGICTPQAVRAAYAISSDQLLYFALDKLLTMGFIDRLVGNGRKFEKNYYSINGDGMQVVRAFQNKLTVNSSTKNLILV